MRTADLVGAERRALADTFSEVGPGRPTLCGDWRTEDLLAHLVIRDRRPDAAPGIFLPGWSWWTARVQRRLAGDDYARLVEIVRTGPPPWVPASLPPLDRIDLLEYVVHHEDVRRAEEPWEPRPPDPDRDDLLWMILAMAGRSAYLRSPVGVTLRRPDGSRRDVTPGRRRVVITGEPGELVLHAVGRDACRVEMDGEPDDVAAVNRLDRGI